MTYELESDLDKPDLVDAMYRRADLLETQTGGAELADVTELLTSALAGTEPRLRRLTLDEDSELLKRLASMEPVQPLVDDSFGAESAGHEELASRVATDRRCFVLEHPQLVGHPMNVVWVALTVGTPHSIQDLLALDRERIDVRSADTAAFYSIWKVEPGLSGIPGGASLLAQVVEALGSELPQLVDFLTLSPIPGFREWSEANPDLHEPLTDTPRAARLTRHCARYLLTLDEDNRPIDPVARFHMRNGARLWQLNWNGDVSSRGDERSYGLMANYRYAPEDLAMNRQELDSARPQFGPQIADLVEETSD